MASPLVTVAPVVDANLLGIVQAAPAPADAVHAGTYIITKPGFAGSNVVSVGSIVTWNKYRNDYIIVGKLGKGQRFLVAGYSATSDVSSELADMSKQIITYTTNDLQSIEDGFVSDGEPKPDTHVTVQFVGSLFAYSEFAYSAADDEWTEISPSRTKEVGWFPQPPAASVDVSQIKGLDLAGAQNGDVLRVTGPGALKASQMNLTDLHDVEIASGEPNRVLTYSGSKWTSEQVRLDGLADVNIVEGTTDQYLYVGENGEWTGKAIETVGGATSLAELTDVDLESAQTGNLLQLEEDGKWRGAMVESDPISLEDLTNVTLSDATAGQVLTLNSDGQWINETPASVITKLSELEDVLVQGALQGDALTFNSAANNWYPQTPAKGTKIVLDLTEGSDVVATDIVARNAEGAVVKAAVTDPYIIGVVSEVRDGQAVIILTGRDLITELQSRNFAPGDLVYLDPTTPGQLINTIPTTPGQNVIQIGVMMSGIEIDVKIDHQGTVPEATTGE